MSGAAVTVLAERRRGAFSADRVNYANATTCGRYKAMTLIKIGTVRQASAVPSLRTAFLGYGVMIGSCPLLSLSFSEAIRSVR
jgi:hypothetical protein